MAATATYIVDILDEHLEELGYLFDQWRGAQRDPDFTLRAVAELEERIRGHLQGVQVPGEQSWPHLVELLDAADADLIFAAAYALLHCNVQHLTDTVLGAYAIAQEKSFCALTTSLAYAPLQPSALDRVRVMLSDQPVSRAVAAAEVLAFHGALEVTGDQLRYFLDDDDAAARRAGWRLAALIGAQLPAKAYAAVLRDGDASVTMAALEAGAWCAVPGVLPALRQLVEPATPERMDALYLLAVVGGAEDVPRIHSAVADPALGPARFALAGAFGASALMPLVLAGLEDTDPVTAAAAGAAFERITGIDVASNHRERVPSADGVEPDEFDAEFQDEVFLPDPAKARGEWERLQPQHDPLSRLCRGADAARALETHGVAIDMLSRHDLLLRARFGRQWQGTLLGLERFPQGVPTPRTAAPHGAPTAARA